MTQCSFLTARRNDNRTKVTHLNGLPEYSHAFRWTADKSHTFKQTVRLKSHILEKAARLKSRI